MLEDENPCQIHIQISSTDRPGILAEVLESVVAFNWDVLDIKQFVFNGLLNLSLLLGSNKSNSISGLQGSLDEWAGGNGVAIMLPDSWGSLSIGITFVKEVSPVSLSLGLVQGKGYSEIGIVFSKSKCVCVGDL